MEIERKFLVPSLPDDLARYPLAVIDQGYLALTPEGVEVRVRRKGGRCFLTVKHGAKLSRTEVELPISLAQFDELWPLTVGRRLRKTRYDLPGPGGLVIELDVYEEALAGLQTADVEFPDEPAAHAFEPARVLRAGDQRAPGLPERKAGPRGVAEQKPPAGNRGSDVRNSAREFPVRKSS